MFSGKIFNKFSGVSKKGNDFYSCDIQVDTPTQRIMYKAFLSADQYNKIKDLPLDTMVTVRCGVNNFGNLCVTDISPASK